MADALHTPDRGVVRALKAIDPGLSVQWFRGRWAVFGDLTLPDFEGTVAAVARELAKDFRAGGYAVEYDACLQMAYEKVREERLVLIVANDDGSYRPLDGRVVAKLRRMDWFRKNWTVRDWQQTLHANDDRLADSRARAMADTWDDVRRDKVFARCLSDILWGLKPARSVQVPGKRESNEARQCAA